MTLDQLAAEENRLVDEVGALVGTIEEKLAQLDQADIYQRYADVYSAYVRLAVDGNLEALKRAIFLQWYSMSDPAFVNGLSGLPDRDQRLIIDLLEELARQDNFDAELRWMLNQYYAIADWYFESFSGVDNLIKWFVTHRTRSFPDDEVRCNSLAGRGQMSDYWYRPNHGVQPDSPKFSGSASRHEVEQHIRSLLATQLGTTVSSINIDTKLRKLSPTLDSLDAIEFVATLGDEFGHNLVETVIDSIGGDPQLRKTLSRHSVKSLAGLIHTLYQLQNE